MTYYNEQLNNRKTLELFIAKCYIFFLPLRMINPLNKVFGIFRTQAEYLDFVFLLLGCFLYIMSRKTIHINKSTTGDRVIYSFVEAVFVCGIISLVMTSYIFFSYGNYKGNSCYVASTKMILNYVQYIFMLAYGKYVISIITPKQIFKILHASIVCLLIIGLIQLAVRFGAFPTTFYDILARILHLCNRYGEISLTTEEPSHAALLFGAIILPYYYTKFLMDERIPRGHILELLLWFVLILLCESSTAYAIFGIETGVMLIWLVTKRNTSISLKIFTFIVSFFMVIVFINPNIIDSFFDIDFTYLFYNKAFDIGNQSTASRYLGIYANILIFLRFPILGCGNGLQGYFYSDYSYLINGKLLDDSTIKLFSGSLDSIANGTTFLSGILSGWGTIGIILFLRFFIKSVKSIKKQKASCLNYYYFYYIALLGILIGGLKSEFVGMPYIWFALSIPCVNFSLYDNKLYKEDGSEQNN